MVYFETMQSSGFHALTLVSKTREYDQVFTLAFEPEVPFDFVPGQYVHLLAPASPPGRENVRHLSIASTPGEGALRFTFDLGSGSDYKKKFAALEVGGKAHLFKVKGEFVLDDPAPPRVVFLAGGLGITPTRALIRHLVDRRQGVDWRLAHVARGPFLYENELAALGGTQARIRRAEVGPLVESWCRDWSDARWYVSGSGPFVEGMQTLLANHGVGAERVRVEDFS